jgi:hypothetical protein
MSYRSKRNESPWHKITITPYRYYDPDTRKFTEETEDDIEHPADCDQLKYGEECWFDREFYESNKEDRPSEPGVYRARVWIEGPDYFGEYDSGNEWEPVSTELQDAS